MRRRSWRILLLLSVAVALVPLGVLGLMVFHEMTSGGQGSPKAADRLRVIVEDIPTPEALPENATGYASKRFEDGEWALGACLDSHAWFSRYCGGGTIVVKDSRGQVRAFFGHVCGDGHLDNVMSGSKNLDGFYKELQEIMGGFVEHPFPDPAGLKSTQS